MKMLECVIFLLCFSSCFASLRQKCQIVIAFAHFLLLTIVIKRRSVN